MKSLVLGSAIALTFPETVFADSSCHGFLTYEIGDGSTATDRVSLTRSDDILVFMTTITEQSYGNEDGSTTGQTFTTVLREIASGSNVFRESGDTEDTFLLFKMRDETIVRLVSSFDDMATFIWDSVCRLD